MIDIDNLYTKNLNDFSDQEILNLVKSCKHFVKHIKDQLEENDDKSKKEIDKLYVLLEDNKNKIKAAYEVLKRRNVAFELSNEEKRAKEFDDNLTHIKSLTIKKTNEFNSVITTLEITFDNEDVCLNIYSTCHHGMKGIIKKYKKTFLETIKNIDIGEWNDLYGEEVITNGESNNINALVTISYDNEIEDKKVICTNKYPYNYYSLYSYIWYLTEIDEYEELNKKKVNPEDYKLIKMPKKHYVYYLKRKFTKKDIEKLSYGVMPDGFDDKWICYFKDNKFYAHRGWTGFCIFIIYLNPHSLYHKIIINCDPHQFKDSCIARTLSSFDDLLTEWTHRINPYNSFNDDYDFNSKKCVNYVPDMNLINKGEKFNTCNSCLYFKRDEFSCAGNDYPICKDENTNEELGIVGIKYIENKDKILNNISVHDRLKLVKDPTNKYDSNAIKVTTLKGKHVGYISKHKTHELEKYFDGKKEVIASVTKISFIHENIKIKIDN